ncbi:MAG: AAA family ATPase [Hyphomicrobiales bacterium]
MIIIGITGTLGAGKGTIVEYLENKEGFSHFSVRNYLIEVIKNRGLEVNRDSMTMVANELRKNNSPSFIIDEIYAKAAQSGKDCIIESIRTPGEIQSLKTKGDFTLLAVDADSKIRYERITERKSETDRISFETFIANEQREMTTDDPNKQNLKKCIDSADFVLNNDGSIDDLHKQVEEILTRIK